MIDLDELVDTGMKIIILYLIILIPIILTIALIMLIQEVIV